jgi:hypothetical protein
MQHWKTTALAALMATGASLAAAPQAQAVACSDIVPVILYQDFTSCTAPGNDNFATVSGIVNTLFGGVISLIGNGSFSPGPGSGDEFGPGDTARDGLELDGEPVDFGETNTFTFLSLPVGTLFVSLKQSTNFELFRVPDSFLNGSATSFTLTHSLVPNGSTSHLSTFKGTGYTPPPDDEDPPPIPLPAAGFLLIGGLGALAALRRRRRA